MKLCPCGSDKNYMECCGAYLNKKRIPHSPEALMRSRYTAFVERNAYYIKQTMRGPARQNFNQKSIENSKGKWLGLEVLKSFIDLENPYKGFVEFKAKYMEQEGQDIQIIHERSEFHYIDGRWYYVNGEKPA